MKQQGQTKAKALAKHTFVNSAFDKMTNSDSVICFRTHGHKMAVADMLVGVRAGKESLEQRKRSGLESLEFDTN